MGFMDVHPPINGHSHVDISFFFKARLASICWSRNGLFFFALFFATKNSPFGKSDDKPWDLGGYHFFKQVQIDPIKQVIFDRKKNMDDFLAKAYYQIYKGFS